MFQPRTFANTAEMLFRLYLTSSPTLFTRLFLSFDQSNDKLDLATRAEIRLYPF
jgi:hypothetical protein